jgi:integrase
LFDIKDKAATAWNSRFRDRCSVAHINDNNERRVFHSFRHWVITQARAKAGRDALIQQVVDHEKTNAGAIDRYTDEMPMTELRAVIECLYFNRVLD